MQIKKTHCEPLQIITLVYILKLIISHWLVRLSSVTIILHISMH